MAVDEIYGINKALFVSWWCQLIRKQVQLPVKKAVTSTVFRELVCTYLHCARESRIFSPQSMMSHG